jgi:hypothetical protein
MVSGRNVIGRMRARIDVMASAQTIGWQLIAIHVKRMGLFYDVKQVWNEHSRQKDCREVSGNRSQLVHCVVGRDAKWKRRISEGVFLIWLKQ